MIASFISRHLVWDLPESFYDLADRDDTTLWGRRFLVALLFAHAAASAWVAGAVLL